MPLMPRPCLSSTLAGSAVAAAVSRKQVTLLVMDWKLSLSVSVVLLALSIADILDMDTWVLCILWSMGANCLHVDFVCVWVKSAKGKNT